MTKVVNPFDSTGFIGKKKADQTGRRNFFGSGYVIKLKTLLNALYFWRFFYRFSAIFSIKTLSVVLHFLPI